MNRLEPSRSLILVVDVQDKLCAVMPEEQMAALGRSVNILLEAAHALAIPVVATEQYPQGLGPTIASVKERLATVDAPVLSKVEFSAAEAPGFNALLDKRSIRDVIVVGMETHVCVYQTVRELVQRGLSVHVPIDGVVSRREDHRQAGLDLCRAAGGLLTTTETVAFDWLRKAGGDAFKRVSRAVK